MSYFPDFSRLRVYYVSPFSVLGFCVEQREQEPISLPSASSVTELLVKRARYCP